MFIQTETSQDPYTLRFLPGQAVLTAGNIVFEDTAAAQRSPLAAGLFALGSMSRIVLGVDYIDVTLDGDVDWAAKKPQVLAQIMDHFVAGTPVLLDAPAAEDGPESDQDDAEIIAQIEELLETRIRPSVASTESAVTLKQFRNGVVELEISADAIGFLGPIGNMMRHYIPEIVAVREYRDAADTPGLATPEGRTVQRLLDEEINPAVASHGGHISLVDVQEDIVYIRLEGGCQGCGMADVTLKQGIETAIIREMPDITAVRDVTDHAGGSNPYYQPSQK